MDLERTRNVGIVAHIDAGKTTVTERILFYSGVEHRMGEVHEGTAVMDWMQEERRRGITITAAATTVPWREHTINLVDTPGHVDFTVEVERCMRVLDGAVLVLNGVAGVQAQSETVWRQMDNHGVPFVVFVNQCDRAGADPFRALEDLRQRLGVPAVPVQFPLGTEREFRALVDLVSMEAWEFPEADQGRARSIPIPAQARDEVGVLRAELVEAAADYDEAVLAAMVEEREPAPQDLRRALRRGVLERTLVPVLCGAALRNVGIEPLMDAIVEYLPAPSDVPAVEGQHPKSGEALQRRPSPDEPLCALAFKLQSDPHEDLTYVRVYSGLLEPGARLENPRARKKERLSRILQMHADERRAVESAGPGSIVAVTGCKFTATGDTLCTAEAPITLESLTFPEPVIRMVVEPRSTADRERLGSALERLAHEDPTFHVREDEETGQWEIAGMGELHLEVVRHRLEEEFGLEVGVGNPRVAYREAVASPGSGQGKVDRVVGGKELWGVIDLAVEPAEDPGAPGVTWGPDCAVPELFREGIAEALRLGAQVGPRFGFPLVQARLAVGPSASNPTRESEAGFSQAALLALRQAMAGCRVELLEPVMAFEIQAPSEFMSGILAELNGKRAEIQDLLAEEDLRTVVGRVPLANMFGYSTTLRSLSQGRASFSLFPDGFRPVPEEELAARGLTWE